MAVKAKAAAEIMLDYTRSCAGKCVPLFLLVCCVFAWS